jgi:ComF family protein
MRLVRAAAAIRPRRAFVLLDAPRHRRGDRARAQVRRLAERAALVPVPLSARRLRERGYNQSEHLARGLARAWRVPIWSDALERARNTETQTRLTPAERLANVSGAFRAGAARLRALKHAHVVLVDDVVTTAATLNACAAALIAGGARIVSYVTFARAPTAGDR